MLSEGGSPKGRFWAIEASLHALTKSEGSRKIIMERNGWDGLQPSELFSLAFQFGTDSHLPGDLNAGRLYDAVTPEFPNGRNAVSPTSTVARQHPASLKAIKLLPFGETAMPSMLFEANLSRALII
jgi:hypothetical protein